MKFLKALYVTTITVILLLEAISVIPKTLAQVSNYISPYTTGIPGDNISTTQANPNNLSSNTNPVQDGSINWSGYIASEGKYTGVMATWTIPIITDASTRGADAAWVGIGGVTSDDLIQAGTQAAVDRNGEITYQAFYETLPDISQPFDININGGDNVSVSIMRLSNGKWEISFKNNTTGKSVKMVKSYDSSLSSAEWIEEAPTGIRGQIINLHYFYFIDKI